LVDLEAEGDLEGGSQERLDEVAGEEGFAEVEGARGEEECEEGELD
jgi:hypothetical protein